MTVWRTNWRLLRVAESICSCLLTDGFCGPKNNPDCRCWVAARAAIEGLQNQANPCLQEAWPRMFNDDERRGNLNLLVKAILTKEDELTAMHAAEPSHQDTTGVTMETKGCTRCKRNRPIKDFQVLKNGKLFSWCNFCFALKERSRKASRRTSRKVTITLPPVTNGDRT